jgi:hypothetical protein
MKPMNSSLAGITSIGRMVGRLLSLLEWVVCREDRRQVLGFLTSDLSASPTGLRRLNNFRELTLDTASSFTSALGFVASGLARRFGIGFVLEK